MRSTRGHVVYLHCRAGIGRSATVAGCWLATSGGEASSDPLAQLQVLWQQSERSRGWPVVPETDAQAQFVREWAARATRPGASRGAVPNAALPVADRIRGMLLGLALGDAMGESLRAGPTRPRRLDAAHGPGACAWRRACSPRAATMHATRWSATCAGSATAISAREDCRGRRHPTSRARSPPGNGVASRRRARTTRAIAARQPCRAW